MGNTESLAKQRELVAESGHSVKLSLEHQIIHLHLVLHLPLSHVRLHRICIC